MAQFLCPTVYTATACIVVCSIKVEEKDFSYAMVALRHMIKEHRWSSKIFKGLRHSRTSINYSWWILEDKDFTRGQQTKQTNLHKKSK